MGGGTPAGWQGEQATLLQQWEWNDGENANHEEHITWLELLVGYELDACVEVATLTSLDRSAAGNLERKPGLSAVVTDFKQGFQVLHQHFTRDAWPLFASTGNCTAGKGRLSCYVITGTWLSTSTHPSWPVALRQRVMDAFWCRGELR